MSPGAALILPRVEQRRKRLAEESPDAIRSTAAVLWALHESLTGRAAELAGDRTPRHRRGQLDGSETLTLSDLVFLALEAPDAVAPALELLMALVGRRSLPMQADGGSVHAANGGVLRAFGEFEAAFSEALDDGQLDSHEVIALMAALRDVEDRLAGLKASLASAGAGSR